MGNRVLYNQMCKLESRGHVTASETSTTLDVRRGFFEMRSQALDVTLSPNNGV